jgi:hypothetical protein
MAATAERPVEGAEERPAWALTGEEILTELDAVHCALSRLQTRRWELIARLDELGHARDLGARDTTELLAVRHRLDPATVRRDVKLARALPSYAVVTTALAAHPATVDPARVPTDTGETGGADGAGGADGGADSGLGADSAGADCRRGQRWCGRWCRRGRCWWR